MEQKIRLAALLALCAGAALAADAKYTQVDYPGASATQAWGINSRGDIVGYYTGADKNTHGFLLNGSKYTAIDYPGAAVTLVNGTNPQGDIVGEFGVTATSPHRGFRLGSDGVYVPFDIPGATSTSVTGINARGEFAGTYIVADGTRHGFLLSAGRLTRIDYPAAVQTVVLGITPQGVVTGGYSLGGVNHGMTYSTGAFTTIDYPGATFNAITGGNSSGDLVGRFVDTSNVSHALRVSNGQLSYYDCPGGSFTGFSAVDPAGNIAGRCTVGGVAHGFLLTTTQAATRYTVTDLGLVGRLPGQPIVVTDNRLIAGMVVTDTGYTHAVVWTANGAMTDLGTPGLNSVANAINESGVVVGQTDTADQDVGGEDFCGNVALGLKGSHAACVPFVGQFGAMQPLRTLGGINGSALAVNARGDIAGTAENTASDSNCQSPQRFQFRPVIWQGDDVEELPTATGDRAGIAQSINDRGHAVGESGDCGGFNPNFGNYLRPRHALLWEAGQMVDLGNLGGKGMINGHSAHVINNNDEVVGISDIAGDKATHAFRWTKVSGIQDLGTLDGDTHSIGLGLNDSGVVTGISANADFSALRAFIWRGGVMMDLNKLIPASSSLYLLSACSVNAQGEIIGFSADAKGNLHGYLASPLAAGEGDFEPGASPRGLSAEARERFSRMGLTRLAPR